MFPLGTAAPNFSLTDTVSGERTSLASPKGKEALLVIFKCNHCLYVEHWKDALVKLSKDFEGKDTAIVAISANDAAAHSEVAPDKLGSK
jgi:peroxiredoxin